MTRPTRSFVPVPRQPGHCRHAFPPGERNFPLPPQRPCAVNGQTAHATA
ncbi:MAG: hypothetical protein M3291_02550 [Actinomycetota bacterium]|nr:hypothetical protein [Actinomycetota bacterium]